MERSRVKTHKSFFIKERDQFYSDWMVSFWREFFQNSVDAGAKNIDITINEAPSRGSFEEVGDSSAQVTRVVFTDDGRGMDKDVLDRVYFSIGETTKNDGSTLGGFGRARLMTCFSQERYSILTTDRFVLGDGPDYINLSLDEAVGELSKAEYRLAELAREAASHNVGAEDNEVEADNEAVRLPKLDDINATLGGLSEDRRLVENARRAGEFKGCRVEIDLGHKRTHSWQKFPDASTMQAKLRQYLSESQLSPNVTINGQSPEEFFSIEDGKLQARRGPVKRTLSAEHEGRTRDFATVHTSEGAKAGHKGKMIVRVDGAAMFVEDISADAQVIVEINQAMSRSALNSNRDGLKGDFKTAVAEFIAELNIDNTSAMADRESKHNFTIKGEHGSIRASAPQLSLIATTEVTEDEFETVEVTGKEVSTDRLKTVDNLRARGLSQDVVEEVVRQTYYGSSFLNAARYRYGFPLTDDVDAFIRKVYEGVSDGRDHLDIFLQDASPKLKLWIADMVDERLARTKAGQTADISHTLRDMHDVHVAIISTNEKTKAAIRRNDPRKWDTSSGKGRIPRALLASWTAACSVAVETLLTVRPAMANFNWTTGWVFAVPEDIYQGDRSRKVAIEALYKNKDGMRHFLINPVNDDGTLRFSVTNPQDRQRMLALAMHEVAHTVESYHNETYATVLTDLVGEIDNGAATRRMKDAVRAVMAAYETGKANVQPMDDEPGERPAARLMALANGGADWSRDVACRADGSWSVDCDRDLAGNSMEHDADIGDEEEPSVRYG